MWRMLRGSKRCWLCDVDCDFSHGIRARQPIAELEKYTMSKMMSKIKNILVFKTFLQTVNLLRFASMVRIRPPPPMEKVLEPLRFLGFFFFYFRGLGVIKSTKKYYKNILFGCQKDVRRMSGFERHACGLTWYF